MRGLHAALRPVLESQVCHSGLDGASLGQRQPVVLETHVQGTAVAVAEVEPRGRPTDPRPAQPGCRRGSSIGPLRVRRSHGASPAAAPLRRVAWGRRLRLRPQHPAVRGGLEPPADHPNQDLATHRKAGLQAKPATRTPPPASSLLLRAALAGRVDHLGAQAPLR
jgi:hypothetical protein